MKRLIVLMTALTVMAPPSFSAEKKSAPPKAAPAAQEQGTGAQDAPMSETIKGEVKDQLEIQKPPPSIELESGEFVESGTAQTESVLQEAKPVPSKEDFENYAKLTSNQVLRPWMPL